MIDPPSPAWRVENQDLCPLQPFRPRPVFPIAVAGIEPASMRDQQAHFRAAGKPPRLITRACRVGYLEIVRAGRLHESGDRRKAECQYHENAPARVAHESGSNRERAAKFAQQGDDRQRCQPAGFRVSDGRHILDLQ